jgi:hypothetical protein
MTSLSQASTLGGIILDRLLRRTLQGDDGKVGRPPTQLVGVSTVGTKRFNKFPYSFQNMMGGKLEAWWRIEEVLINEVQRRVTQPPLDSLVKLGELRPKKDGDKESEGLCLETRRCAGRPDRCGNRRRDHFASGGLSAICAKFHPVCLRVGTGKQRRRRRTTIVLGQGVFVFERPRSVGTRKCGRCGHEGQGATNDGRKRGPNRMQWQQGRVKMMILLL